MLLDSEDFDRWREDPVTRAVFEGLARAAEAQQQEWMAASWGGGMVRADRLRDKLMETRLRADCYNSLAEITFEVLKGWLDDQ